MEEKKGVVKMSRNPFDMGDESDDSDNVGMEEVPKVTNVMAVPAGAWGKPLEFAAEYKAGEYDPMQSWGDQDD